MKAVQVPVVKQVLPGGELHVQAGHLKHHPQLLADLIRP